MLGCGAPNCGSLEVRPLHGGRLNQMALIPRLRPHDRSCVRSQRTVLRPGIGLFADAERVDGIVPSQGGRGSPTVRSGRTMGSRAAKAFGPSERMGTGLDTWALGSTPGRWDGRRGAGPRVCRAGWRPPGRITAPAGSPPGRWGGHRGPGPDAAGPGPTPPGSTRPPAARPCKVAVGHGCCASHGPPVDCPDPPRCGRAGVRSAWTSSAARTGSPSS